MTVREPSQPENQPRNLAGSRLARFGLVTVIFGLIILIIGLFPDLVRMGLTPGIGLLQITAAMAGLTLMTLGGYIYAYATRHRALPRRLREDVGLRLMATGLVISYTAGYADVLGIGSHFGAERPLLGPIQAMGIMLGVLIIVTGLVLYARR